MAFPPSRSALARLEKEAGVATVSGAATTARGSGTERRLQQKANDVLRSWSGPAVSRAAARAAAAEREAWGIVALLAVASPASSAFLGLLWVWTALIAGATWACSKWTSAAVTDSQRWEVGMSCLMVGDGKGTAHTQSDCGSIQASTCACVCVRLCAVHVFASVHMCMCVYGCARVHTSMCLCVHGRMPA